MNLLLKVRELASTPSRATSVDFESVPLLSPWLKTNAVFRPLMVELNTRLDDSLPMSNACRYSTAAATSAIDERVVRPLKLITPLVMLEEAIG